MEEGSERSGQRGFDGEEGRMEGVLTAVTNAETDSGLTSMIIE